MFIGGLVLFVIGALVVLVIIAAIVIMINERLEDREQRELCNNRMEGRE